MQRAVQPAITWAVVPQRRLFRLTKHLIDLVGALLLLVLLAPILVACAIAVRRSSPGPILFRQERIRLRGETFGFLKFRSMYVAADTATHQEDVAAVIRSDDLLIARGEPEVRRIAAALDLALDAVAILTEEGVSCEVIDLRTLKPLDTATLLASVGRTERFVFVEEGTGGGGAQVCALIDEEAFGSLLGPPIRVAARDTPIPSAGPLEARVIPQIADNLHGWLASLHPRSSFVRRRSCFVRIAASQGASRHASPIRRSEGPIRRDPRGSAGVDVVRPRRDGPRPRPESARLRDRVRRLLRRGPRDWRRAGDRRPHPRPPRLRRRSR